jgi:hypothetical protein
MLHQPHSSRLTPGSPKPTLKPWYEIGPARQLLELCVTNPPESVVVSAREIEAGACAQAYDPADRRVALLRAVHEAYFEAVQQIDPSLLSQTCFQVGVSEAIDLAIEAARKAAQGEALRHALLAQGLTTGQVEARMMGAAA